MVKLKGVEIKFLGHSGFLLVLDNGKKIVIDPYNVAKDSCDADLILISHSHYDHCSIKDIEKLKKDGTVIIVPADAQSKITKVEGVNMEVMEVGDVLEMNNLKIEAVPAYNVHNDYHPKREGWMGFIIKLDGTIIYHSGDSDKIPEMSQLTGYGKKGNEFVVMLPVSGKYVMDVEEAVEVANLLNPSLCIPMHYGSGVAGSVEDAESFVEKCKEIGIKAEILNKE